MFSSPINITSIGHSQTSEDEEFLKNRFPTIYNECLKRGINISKDRIPVCPVQHYLIGGIETDLDGKTTLDNLYACGEVACTGVHGANRLASNSILECLVFGKRVARAINASALTPPKAEQIPALNTERTSIPMSLGKVRALKTEIKQIMTDCAGAVRTAQGLAHGLSRIERIAESTERILPTTFEEYELCNMTQVAHKVLTDAIARKESAGAHYVV